MANELQRLPTGEVLLRNEADGRTLLSENRWLAEGELPGSYPCLVRNFSGPYAKPVYIYLPDAMSMVEALKPENHDGRIALKIELADRFMEEFDALEEDDVELYFAVNRLSKNRVIEAARRLQEEG